MNPQASSNAKSNGRLDLHLPAGPKDVKHLVLLGASHMRVHVLQGLASSVPAGLKITVVTPHSRQLYSGRVPGFVAGHHRLDECVIPLEKLLAECGARLIQSSAVSMDANARTVTLANGDILTFDWVSLNTGPVMDRQRIASQMPGASGHALFVRPIESFAQLWLRVLDKAKGQKIHFSAWGPVLLDWNWPWLRPMH